MLNFHNGFLKTQKIKTMKKTIKVQNPNNLPTMNYKQFVDFQEDFKKPIEPKALEKLKNSIIEHGIFLPKFVWFCEGKAFILDGHQTKKALASLQGDGWLIGEIPYSEIKADNRDDAGEKLLIINSKYADVNPNSEFVKRLPDLDIVLKKVEIPELKKLELNLESKGTEGKTGDDDLPEPPEPVSELGDLWILDNRHRVYCGDCTVKANVDLLMNGERAELLLTDPPYGIGKSEIHGDQPANLPNIYESIVTNFQLFCIENASCYAFGLYPNIHKLYELMTGAGVFFIQGLYWFKGGGRGNKRRYIPTVENILFFAKDNNSFIWNDYQKDWKHFEWAMAERTSELWQEAVDDPVIYLKRFSSDPQSAARKFTGKKNLLNIFYYSISRGFMQGSGSTGKKQFDKGDKTPVHATMKPVELLEDLINQSSNQNQIVIDPFLGSGSTLLACEKTGRSCVGMEISEKYTDIIIKRWQNFTGKTAVCSSGKQIK